VHAIEVGHIAPSRDAAPLTRGDDCRRLNSHLTRLFADESAEVVGATTPT
jgi:hypothetical protein